MRGRLNGAGDCNRRRRETRPQLKVRPANKLLGSSNGISQREATRRHYWAPRTARSENSGKRSTETRNGKGSHHFEELLQQREERKRCSIYFFIFLCYTRHLAASRRQHQRQGYAKHDKRGEMRKKRETLRMAILIYLFIFQLCARGGHSATAAATPDQQSKRAGK